jgi:putative copper resistance protein D
MPVDAFTGLVLGSEGSNPFPGLADQRPAWAPAPLTDVHIGGAVMWVGGAGIMFGLVMAVFFAWSREKHEDGGLGWLETARRSNFATLVSSHREETEKDPAERVPATRSRAADSVDDDEALAAYNAFLTRINKPQDH